MRIPLTVHDSEGRLLTVNRAWPRDDGRLTLEAVETEATEATEAQGPHDGGRSAASDIGRLRAGVLRPDGTARMAPFAEDPALPDLAAAARSGDLLVHRYRKRAVVRSRGSFLKILPATKAEDVARRHRTAADLALPAGIDVPRVTKLVGGTLTLSALRGASLHDLGRPGSGTSPADIEQGWSAWASRWPRFVQSGAPAGVVGYTPEHEVRTLAAWVDRCLRFDALHIGPDGAGALQAAATCAMGLLLDGPAQEPGLAHRDLHDKQIFVDRAAGTAQGAVGLIDCDTLALAEPALDLANLLVHLEFREAQGLLDAASRCAGERAILDVVEELEVPADRLAAYALATRLRLACVYAFRPRWQGLAVSWFRAAVSGPSVPAPGPATECEAVTTIQHVR